VRAPAEVSFPAEFARLTRNQQEALTWVRNAQEDVDDAQAVVGSTTAELHSKVVRAINEGVPVRLLGQALGVSQSRIYQIRDQVSGYRSER
jgi:hypothetical protein